MKREERKLKNQEFELCYYKTWLLTKTTSNKNFQVINKSQYRLIKVKKIDPSSLDIIHEPNNVFKNEFKSK